MLQLRVERVHGGAVGPLDAGLGPGDQAAPVLMVINNFSRKNISVEKIIQLK